MVFQVDEAGYPQVHVGKQYTVDYIRDGMVYLLGISHPLPMGAGHVVRPSQEEHNTFVQIEYELIERVVAYTNQVGSRTMEQVTTINSKVVEKYVKNAREVQNLSEFILKCE